MPNYPYRCHACGTHWESCKSVSDIDRVETCPACQEKCGRDDRYIGRTHFYGASDWDKAEFNPAFGKVVRNSKHRAQLAKERGYIEVGNENPDKIHDKFEKDRHEKRERSWAEVDRGHVAIS
jgi:putative FmdB family regulatory protein